MSSSTGSVQTGSFCRITSDNYSTAFCYYIRIKNPNGRPTVTISGIPTSIKAFSLTGGPTLFRIGTSGCQVTDNSYIDHTANSSTMTIQMFNYIGNVPSGNGYVVLSGSFII